MKKAFTLAESMVVIMVIAVIATLVLRSIQDMQPDREKIMFKKAYQIAEKTVGEIVNDEAVYPYHSNKIGFYNDERAYIEGTNTYFEGDEKFCQFFANKLNTIGAAQYVSQHCAFETTDGIRWISLSKFDPVNNPHILMRVDINGNEKPNYPDYTPNEVKNDNTLIKKANLDPNIDRDRFYIMVNFDGRLSVIPETDEEDFLKSHDAAKNR